MLKEKLESVVPEVSLREIDQLVKISPTLPEAGALVKGTVIGRGKMALFVDVPPFGSGIIFGREYLNARETIKSINIGETITAKVITPEGENGYMELSLKEAKQAIIWNEAEVASQKKTVFELAVTDANKGGLIIAWNGLQGFLPASQLAPAHYPRVPDGDKEKIFVELKKLVGEKDG